MTANLKKSLKLLTYGYKFKYNMIISGLLLVAVTFLYILVFWSNVNLFILNYILLYVALMMPSQIREDLLHSQILASSGFRRFFDIHFADIYAFVFSIIAYLIHGGLLLLFYKEGSIQGETLTTLLVSAGFCMGAMTTSFAMINKTFFAGVLIYFFVGFCDGVSSAVISDLERDGLLHFSNGVAFWIGFGLVIIGLLIAMGIRRLVYKKPFSRFSTGEKLRKAMQQ